MEKFHQSVAWLSLWAGRAAGLILVLMLAHIALEITLRSVFSRSTFVLDEFVGYALAAMTFLAMGQAFRDGEFIRIHLLLVALRGRVRQAVEIVCTLAALSAGALLAWYVFRLAFRDWDRGVTSDTIARVPKWIPEGIVFLGLALFCLQLVSYLLHILTDPDRHLLRESAPRE